MKAQTFLLVLFLIATSVKSVAQLFKAPDDSKIHFVFTGGYMQSEIKGSFVDYQLDHYFGTKKPELHGKEGIGIEALANLKVYKFLYALTGIGYNEQGGEIKYNQLVYPIDITLRYIHVPVLVGANLITLKKFTVSVETGFQFNQEISSEQDFKKGTTTIKSWSKTFIPAFTYKLLIQYQIKPGLGIQGSYQAINSTKPFYEEEYFDRTIEMSTEAKCYSLGLVLSMNK